MKLIISADDFGMSKGTTYGIIYGLKKGIITSTSIIANLDYTDYAIEQAKLNGIKEIGLHVNLIIGKSLTNNVKIGFTKNDRTSKEIEQTIILNSITYQEAKDEILAQFEYVTEKGVENKSPRQPSSSWNISSNNAGDDRRFKRKKYTYEILESELKEQINKNGVKTPDIICRDFFKDNAKKETLVDLIDKNRNEDLIIEIMTHVAFMDDYTYEFTDYIDRENELKVLEDFKLEGGFADIDLVSHNIFK